MSNLVARVRRIARRRDEGATAVEYGLLIALIAVVLAAGAYALGTALNTKLDDVGSCVTDSGPDGAGC
jgi:pilus assembly protein Flp/PilA